MKAVFFLAMGLFASATFADQGTCPIGQGAADRVGSIVEAVKATKDCNQAADLAAACEYGASADADIAGAAADICGAEMNQNGATKADHRMLTEMYNACNAQWSKRSGSLYISTNAFCQLEATRWMANLTSGNNE